MFLVVALVVAAGCSKKATTADQPPTGSASGSGSAVAPASGSGSGAAIAPVEPPPVPAAKCTGIPQGFKGSCGHCQEFTGSGFKADGSEYGAKEGCTRAGSKFSSTERCPSDKLIGRCLANCGQPSELVTFEYPLAIEGYPNDEASRKKSCEEVPGRFWMGK